MRACARLFWWIPGPDLWLNGNKRGGESVLAKTNRGVCMRGKAELRSALDPPKYNLDELVYMHKTVQYVGLIVFMRYLPHFRTFSSM